MGSDLVNNGSCHLQPKPSISVNGACRDFGKKKRTNRSAKLKQCKLDARREQWLSQGCKDGVGGFSSSAPLNLGNFKTVYSRSSSSEENEDGSLGTPLHRCAVNSQYTGDDGVGSRPERPGSSSTSGCSGCLSDDEGEDLEDGGQGEDDDGILDDWEAVADALTINDRSKLVVEPAPAKNCGNVQGVFKPDYKGKSASLENSRNFSGRAWGPDDSSRPLSLPNLSKQRNFPERNCGHTGDWIRSQPPSSTCSCGFRLCLFCHKRILEADGRCPGCRKQYTDDGAAKGGSCVQPALEFQRLFRSSSMTRNATRS